MNNGTTEIRYLAGGQYVTETFTGTNTQAAISSIQARWHGQNVQINTIKHIPEPPPSNSGGSSNKR